MIVGLIANACFQLQRADKTFLAGCHYCDVWQKLDHHCVNEDGRFRTKGVLQGRSDRAGNKSSAFEGLCGQLSPTVLKY